MSLLARSIEAWENDAELIDRFPQFDSIVTDPPFGRRERLQIYFMPCFNKIIVTFAAFLFRAFFDTKQTIGSDLESNNSDAIDSIEGFHNDSKLVIIALLKVAARRLKPGGWKKVLM